MRTAAAQSGRANERSAHKVAEKMARNAGVDLDDWVAEAIAEYAQDLGVAPADLNERERLEAIEERIDRLARSVPAPARRAPEETERRPSPEPRSETYDAPRERRAAAPAQESFQQPAHAPDPLEQAIARIERRSERRDPAPVREEAHGRLEAAISEIEQRAERNEQRTARALESLAGLVEARGEQRGRLEETVAEIEKRAERNEQRTARALQSLAGLVEARDGEKEREKERLHQAIAGVEARAEKTAQRTAHALESLTGMVEARKADRDRLESAIERIGKRAEQSEARTARALESLANLVQQPAAPAQPAPRDDAVASRLDALARRAGRAPDVEKPAVDGPVREDEDTFRLVADRLARRRRQRGDASPAPAEAPAAPPAKAEDDAVTEMQRQLQRLADRVEALARPAEPAPQPPAPVADPSVERIERQLAGLAERVERLASPPEPAKPVETAPRRPAADARPLEELSRRLDAIRATVERQSARPEGPALAAALAHLGEKLDRVTATGAQSAATMAALQGAVGRLEEALKRPTPVAIDPRPIEELARRIDSVRGLAPKIDEINAAVSDLREKLSRPATSPAEMERMEAAMRRLSADVAALARQPSVDLQPVEELSRRVEAMRTAVESHGALAPQVERMERTLAEVRVQLDRPTTVDPQPMEDLARRIDAVRSLAERGFAPHAARLDAALADIRTRLDRPAPAVDAALRELAAKVEEAGRRPTLDPRLLEELARRLDAVKSVAERGFAPHAARLDSALADIRAKLDEAAARPTTVALDPKPIEELARRIESVRESLEKPQTLSPQVERLESALGAVADRLERAQPGLDAQGLNHTLAAMNARLEEAFNRSSPAEIDRDPIDALAAQVEAVRETVERHAGQLDIGRLEEAFREAVEKLDRPGLGPQEFRAIVAAIQALANKIDGIALGSGSADGDVLQRIAERLERPAVEPGDLAALADAVADLADKPAPAFDNRRVEDMLGQVLNRLDGPVAQAADFATMADALAALSDKFDMAGAPVGQRIEDLLHDVAARIEGVEAKIESRPAESSDEALAHVELAVRELSEKLGQGRALEQEMRLLQDKLDDIADSRLSGESVEHTAKAIAQQLADRLGGAIPAKLLGHVQDIHERLDVITSSRPAPAALEQAMIELTEELEAFRSARETVTRGAATLSEMRAEQAQLDRRMDARFSGVQEVLEKLVDRLGRLDGAGPALSTRPAAPSSPSRSAMNDIPDRAAHETRPAAPSLDAAALVAPARPRDGAEGAKAAVINAHIAAARRAANAAAADSERREELEAARKSAEHPGVAQRAALLFNQHRRPVLLGAAGLLTLATGVAVVEMRGHAPVRKSELEAPATPLANYDAGSPDTAKTDMTPTGAIAPAPRVIAAPLPPKVEAAPKPAAALVSALPAGVGAPLVAAAGNGDLGAEMEIAQRFLEGRTVPRDPKIAAQWIQTAADSGNAFAQYRLGALYEKGVGVPRDAARARELYTKAAQAGNARAMHNLAVLFAQDGGAGKPDYSAALDWFRKAAGYGVRDSQFNLGVLYGRGLGSAQDLAQSWMWFSVAARQGDADAARKRDEVANRMDGRAMAAAQKLLDGYKAKTPDPAVNDPPPAPAAATAGAPAADKTSGGVKG